jgi:hypothetical protein
MIRSELVFEGDGTTKLESSDIYVEIHIIKMAGVWVCDALDGLITR